MGVEGLQVRVEVDPPVGRVGEPVQPLAASRVGAVGDHPEHVLGSQAVQRDPVAVERAEIDRRAVEGDRPTAGAVRSRKADEPGALQPNLITMTERNMRRPLPRVRSSSTW